MGPFMSECGAVILIGTLPRRHGPVDTQTQQYEPANDCRSCTTKSNIEEHTADRQVSARRVRVRNTAGTKILTPEHMPLDLWEDQ